MSFFHNLFKSKEKSMINNIRFVFFTNEHNVKFAELCLKHFFKHNKREGLKITLLSNKFIDNNFEHSDKVTYMESNIDKYSQGYHFGKSLLNLLQRIEEDYIFYFCDDYFFIDEIKYDDLEELLNMMVCDNIDYFGFDNVGGIYPINEFEKYTSQCINKYKEHFYFRRPDYQYLYSVQPCIWNRKSFIKILSRHENISLHDLDETKDYLVDGSLKTIINDLNSCFDHVNKKPTNDDYFIIAYNEIVRHGCFNIPENGKPINPNDNGVLFTYKLMEDEGMIYKPEFKHLMDPKLYKGD